MINGGRSVPSVAKDLGLNPQTIYNWLGEFQKSQDPDKVRIAELESELKKYKKRVEDQEMTINIFKKATSIFVQDNQE